MDRRIETAKDSAVTGRYEIPIEREFAPPRTPSQRSGFQALARLGNQVDARGFYLGSILRNEMTARTVDKLQGSSRRTVRVRRMQHQRLLAQTRPFENVGAQIQLILLRTPPAQVQRQQHQVVLAVRVGKYGAGGQQRFVDAARNV